MSAPAPLQLLQVPPREDTPEPPHAMHSLMPAACRLCCLWIAVASFIVFTPPMTCCRCERMFPCVFGMTRLDEVAHALLRRARVLECASMRRERFKLGPLRRRERDRVWLRHAPRSVHTHHALGVVALDLAATDITPTVLAWCWPCWWANARHELWIDLHAACLSLMSRKSKRTPSALQ